MSAANLMTANSGRGQRFWLEKIEGTEGTDSSPVVADWQDYDTCEIVPAADYEPFAPVHGYRPGSKGTVTAQRVTISRSRKLRARAVTAGDATDVPNFDAQARSSGAVRTSDATGKIHIYSFGVSQGETATIKEKHNTASAGDGVTTTALGARTGFKCRIASGETWMGSGEGMGVPGDPANGRTPESGAFDGSAATDPFSGPIPAKGCTFRIYDIGAAAVITGGSLGTPGTTPAIISLEYDDQATISLRESAQAAAGVAGTIRDAGAGQLTIRMERDDYDAWNPHAAFAAQRALEVWVQRAAGPTNTNIGFLFTGVISAQPTDLEVGNGRYITTIVLSGLSQPGASDSPAAGVTPGQGPVNGTNRGLPVAVSGVPAGPAHLMVWTTA